MTEARGALYANAQWLVTRLCAEAMRPALDRQHVLTLGALVSGLLDQLEAEESGPIADRCPALDRWRQQVLDVSGRMPLETAAAWELTAIVCEQEGVAHLAEHARANAHDALNRRVA